MPRAAGDTRCARSGDGHSANTSELLLPCDDGGRRQLRSDHHPCDIRRRPAGADCFHGRTKGTIRQIDRAAGPCSRRVAAELERRRHPNPTRRCGAGSRFSCRHGVRRPGQERRAGWTRGRRGSADRAKPGGDRGGGIRSAETYRLPVGCVFARAIAGGGAGGGVESARRRPRSTRGSTGRERVCGANRDERTGRE